MPNGDYVVQPGETIGGIAKKLGTTVAQLQKLNPGMTDPNKVLAKAKIITKASPAPAPEAPAPEASTSTSVAKWNTFFEKSNFSIKVQGQRIKITSVEQLVKYLSKDPKRQQAWLQIFNNNEPPVTTYNSADVLKVRDWLVRHVDEVDRITAGGPEEVKDPDTSQSSEQDSQLAFAPIPPVEELVDPEAEDDEKPIGE